MNIVFFFLVQSVRLKIFFPVLIFFFCFVCFFSPLNNHNIYSFFFLFDPLGLSNLLNEHCIFYFSCSHYIHAHVFSYCTKNFVSFHSANNVWINLSYTYRCSEYRFFLFDGPRKKKQLVVHQFYSRPYRNGHVAQLKSNSRRLFVHIVQNVLSLVIFERTHTHTRIRMHTHG